MGVEIFEYPNDDSRLQVRFSNREMAFSFTVDVEYADSGCFEYSFSYSSRVGQNLRTLGCVEKVDRAIIGHLDEICKL